MVGKSGKPDQHKILPGQAKIFQGMMLLLSIPLITELLTTSLAFTQTIMHPSLIHGRYQILFQKIALFESQ
jgi:hypothetical protein